MGRSRTLCGLIAATAAFATAAGVAEAADPLRPQQYGLDIVEADAAHATATGRGAIVAIVDTGVRPSHQDLQGRLLPEMNFVPNDGPEDEDGHGTHVLGIAVANKDNGVGVSSVAPGATALPVRVLGDDGSGSSADVAKGIDYAVSQGAHVINLSLGDALPIGAVGSIFGGTSPVEDAIKRAFAKDIVVVASSGNNGLPVCEQGLRDDPRLLCVGAVDRNRQRAFYSSGVGPEGVVAPGGNALGDDILSTFSLRNGAQTDSGYTKLAGTSQAAPHVAGVAALLVERGLRGRQVVDRIRATAVDGGLPGPDQDYGAGIVNARAAVAGIGPQSAPGGGTGTGTGGGDTGGTGTGGGGTGGGDTGGGSGQAATVSVARFQRFRSVLKTGIKVRCTATAAGRCTATVRRGSRIFASGSRIVRSGRGTTLLVRLNKSARRAATGAKRRNRRIRLSLEVTVPGAATQLRRTTLRR